MRGFFHFPGADTQIDSAYFSLPVWKRWLTETPKGNTSA